MLLRNTGNGTFADVTASVGAALAGPRPGRGMAVSDYDNDGDVHVLIANVNTYPCLLENRGASARHWLTVRLVGRRSNRDGIGAREHCHRWRRLADEEVRSGASYLSQSDRREHVGLGETSSIASVEIRWPSGEVDRLADVPVDRAIVVREGDRTFTLTPGRQTAPPAAPRR